MCEIAFLGSVERVYPRRCVVDQQVGLIVRLSHEVKAQRAVSERLSPEGVVRERESRIGAGALVNELIDRNLVRARLLELQR
jgi:hypothetical protein